MILIDTHIWLWWGLEAERLHEAQTAAIAHERETEGVIGVSVISCWEIAKLVQLGRMELPMPVSKWLDLARRFPNVHILPLTVEIAVASTQLPDGFRSDPMDEILVATARHYNCPLVTLDRKIRAYGHVGTIPET